MPHQFTEYEIDEMPADAVTKNARAAVPDNLVSEFGPTEASVMFLKLQGWHIRIETDSSVVSDNPGQRPIIASIAGTIGTGYREARGATLTEALQRVVLKASLPTTDKKGEWA